MTLVEGQVQVRDLVMGPGTVYRLQDGFNPWSRSARADQGAARAWADGVWSGAEWVDQATVPIPVFIDADDIASWTAAHQKLVAAFAPSSDDIELRWMLGGTEYLMRGRPRVVDPDTSLIGLGLAMTRCAFAGLDPTIYSGGDEHSVVLGLPSTSGGLVVPAPAALNDNSSFEAGTTSWSGVNATIAASTSWAHDGSTSLLITPDGVSASGGASAATRVAVTAGKAYRASLWAKTSQLMSVGPAVDWYDATSGGTYLSTSFVGPTSVAANTPTHLAGAVTAPAGALGAVMRARHAGTPTAAMTWQADEVKLTDPNSTGLVIPAGGLAVPGTVTSGSATITNAGTKPVGLVLRVDGPVSQPRIVLLADDGTSATLRLWLDLDAGQWLDIDTAARTVYLQGTASRRGNASGDWPVLRGRAATVEAPVSAELSFDAGEYSADARLTVTWRDAWY